MSTEVTIPHYFSTVGATARNADTQPLIHQHGREVQTFGTVRQFPIALSYEARTESCELLNRVLANSMILCSLYKKHHWLVRGHTSYQLHLLLDQHAREQVELIDTPVSRVPRRRAVVNGADPVRGSGLLSRPR